MSQSVTDILGGSISGMMLNLVTAKPHVEAGQLRILGISSSKRSSAMPEVPTIAEVGVPDYEALQWFGLLARGGTPPEILNRLQKLIADGMRTPEMQARLKTEGADAVVNTPERIPEADRRRDRALDQARGGDQPEAGVSRIVMAGLVIAISYPTRLPDRNPAIHVFLLKAKTGCPRRARA